MAGFGLCIFGCWNKKFQENIYLDNKICFLELVNMHKEDKITLPKVLQKEMIEFFLKTSIPRMKKEQQKKQRILSENEKTDRSDENVNENRDLY